MASKPKLFSSDIKQRQNTSGKFSVYIPWGVEYCETDFGLNGGRTVNKTARAAVLWK